MWHIPMKLSAYELQYLLFGKFNFAHFASVLFNIDTIYDKRRPETLLPNLV